MSKHLKGGLFTGRKPRPLESTSVFTKRTYQVYREASTRLLFKTIERCTIDEFRAFVRGQLDSRVRCPHCHKLLDESNFSVDHMQPLSRGGAHTVENMKLVCSFCNKAKGDFEEEVFVAILEAAERAGAQCGQRNARGRLIERLARGLGAIYQQRQRRK